LKSGFGLALMLIAVSAGMAQRPVPVATQSTGVAGTEAAAHISFTFDRPGLAVPKFTITVNEDGTGRYVAEEVLPAPSGAEAPATQHIDRAISLTPATAAQIFESVRALDRFSTPCESPVKHIADTGKKTLRYTDAAGDTSCVYNYSQDKRVVLLTNTFLGIAATLDLGRKLDFEHRFDRLGLDATMTMLTEQLDSGRALEVVTIAPTLQSIARDSEVLERVRLQAARLLKQAQPGS